MNWFSSSDIPNWITLLIEMGFAILITVLVFRIQSRSDSLRAEGQQRANLFMDTLLTQINKATTDIRTEIREQKQLEATRKKLYIKRLKEILEHFKVRDFELKDFIAEFKKAPKNPGARIQHSLLTQRDNLEQMCSNAEAWLLKLESLLTNPQLPEELMGYLPILYLPYEYLVEDSNWVQSPERIKVADETIDVHLPEIDRYLELLSREEVTVTNSIS